MTRKKSLENKLLPSCDFMFGWRSTLQRDWFARRKIKCRELKIYLLFTHVKTSNAVISHCCDADDHTGLFLSACRTSSTLFYLIQPMKYFLVDVALAARTFVQTNIICMRAKCQCNRNYFIQWRKSLIYFPLWSLFCLLPGNKDTYQGKCVLRLSLGTK